MRKRVTVLDKEHTKSFKKMKAVVKKKSQAVEKMSKKVKKKSGDAELCEEHEMKMRDLSITGNKSLKSSLEKIIISFMKGTCGLIERGLLYETFRLVYVHHNSFSLFRCLFILKVSFHYSHTTIESLSG